MDHRERKQEAEKQKKRELFNQNGKELKPNWYEIQDTQKL
jgi:hypothetical protein